ncbi:hypothetical protein WKW80_26960 [Variovorax humicola]|uniref:Uncharacterized protein n=1 Tax=Variovorax humicola TaxID=1769758 RepID=A0ABU8W6E6_9BURK
MMWNYEDYLNGRCAASDIGAPKPPDTRLLPEVLDPKEPLTGRLERDAHAAYVELGGKEYLKTNKPLLDKLLTKAATAAPLSTRQSLAQEFPELHWVSARRLAYKETVTIAQDIKDKRDVDSSTSSGAAKSLPPKEE